MVRPDALALRRATVGEMAMSPRKSPRTSIVRRLSEGGVARASEGNESTSVVLGFLRNRPFRRFISVSVTKRTNVAARRNPTARFIRVKKRSMAGSGTRTRDWAFWMLRDWCAKRRRLGSRLLVTIQRLRYRLFGGRQFFGLPVSIPASLRLHGVVLFVGTDDLLDQIVAHDVFLAELDDADSGDAAANLHGFDQSGLFAGGKVDLGDIAGDHG